MLKRRLLLSPGWVITAATLAACAGRTGLPIEGSGGSSSSSSVSSVSVGAGGQGGAGGAFGVVELALGAGHSCLRTLVGDVYCWGDNTHGQLGTPGIAGSLVPAHVDLPGRARSIAAGTYHACAVLEDERLYCWGKNADDEVSASQADEPSPVAVPLPNGKILDLSLGEAHSCVIADTGDGDGALYCWGKNASGQVGAGSAASPVATPTLVGIGFSEIALGGFHSSGITNAFLPDGTIQARLAGWGTNAELQLGFATTSSDVLSPTTTSFGGLGRVASGMGDHTCAIGDASSPGVFCWGSNSSGQLGRGTTTEKELPGLVGGLAPPVDAVAPGFAHTCALAAGRVYCWGANGSGQLGNGGTGPATLPIEGTGLTGVQAIGSGTLHTCAFLSDTDIRCWGGNDFGQLGDGTTTTRFSPTPVVLPGG